MKENVAVGGETELGRKEEGKGTVTGRLQLRKKERGYSDMRQSRMNCHMIYGPSSL